LILDGVLVNDFSLCCGFYLSSTFYFSLIFIGDFFIAIGETGAFVIDYTFFLTGVEGIDFLQGFGEA
jgi:hypothetical protein